MNSQQDIRIEVAVRYLTEQSDPDADRYAFAYTVEICNRGMVTVKLLTRYWHITDDNEKVEEVRGEGVIGQQPRDSTWPVFSTIPAAPLSKQNSVACTATTRCKAPAAKNLLPRYRHSC